MCEFVFTNIQALNVDSTEDNMYSIPIFSKKASSSGDSNIPHNDVHDRYKNTQIQTTFMNITQITTNIKHISLNIIHYRKQLLKNKKKHTDWVQPKQKRCITFNGLRNSAKLSISAQHSIMYESIYAFRNMVWNSSFRKYSLEIHTKFSSTLQKKKKII